MASIPFGEDLTTGINAGYIFLRNKIETISAQNYSRNVIPLFFSVSYVISNQSTNAFPYNPISPVC